MRPTTLHEAYGLQEGLPGIILIMTELTVCVTTTNGLQNPNPKTQSRIESSSFSERSSKQILLCVLSLFIPLSPKSRPLKSLQSSEVHFYPISHSEFSSPYCSDWKLFIAWQHTFYLTSSKDGRACSCLMFFLFPTSKANCPTVVQLAAPIAHLSFFSLFL